MLIEHGDPEEQSDEQAAIEMGHILNQHYPNHPWVISFQGGALIIRHLAIAQAMNAEMGAPGFGACVPRSKLGTPKQMNRSVVRFAGEMLEAFGLKRGAWQGESPVIPRNWNRGQRQDFT